jgi:catechol 2,3-dioxygenase-like lactoylglutathione lyase family enzyme
LPRHLLLRKSGPTKEEAMLDHVAIPVRNLEASRKFYEPLFEGLGAKVVMEWPGVALFGTDDLTKS